LSHFAPHSIALTQTAWLLGMLFWVIRFAFYLPPRVYRTLARNPALNALSDWVERGLVLGALGGLCGFFISGLVHYNWGDSEVVMIFYCIVGLTLALERKVRLASQ
jgi:hypothetical protein